MTATASPFPTLAHGLATLDAFPIAGALQISPDQPGVDFDALERARAVLVQAWRNDLTPDEITDLAATRVQTRVNGETLQRGTTANLIFGPAELVVWLSRTMTLLPGDIIATGTPAGVGAAQGRFLRAGDTVEVEVRGLGTLTNPISAAA